MMHATTILAVRCNGNTAMAADGQCTSGDVVLKSNIKKIKKYEDGKILVGFAGGVADAIVLLDYFEVKLKSSHDLEKAAIALAKEWRTNKRYEQVSAQLLLADAKHLLVVSGAGDVIAAEDNCMAIGSGGQFALAASKAYLGLKNPNFTAIEIAKNSLLIASEICIYTNNHIIVEEVNG